MKVKIALALLVTLAVALYFWPSRLLHETPPAVPEAVVAQSEPATSGAEPTPTAAQENEAEAQRRAELEAAYAGLEAARRDLRRQLDGLKAKIWGVEFPPGQAKQISDDLLKGYAMLNNPPLLGAFGSAAEIESEQAKIDAMQFRLADVEKLIEEAANSGR